MKTIQIDLPGRHTRYNVRIGNGIVENCLADLLAGYPEESVFIITNSRLAELYPGYIQQRLPSVVQSRCLVLPDGEMNKNLEQLAEIYNFLAASRANRKSTVIAFGGGVIGDIAGFAASTFMRGIACVQVPTTLLSQVDSGIGGKTGINLEGGKNMVGTFAQPLQTIIDVDFLQTLPHRQFIAGYAELLKHGLIRDAYLFRILEQRDVRELRQDPELLSEAVFRSCEVKARIVEADERETNQRAILNFGHTIGHFLETYTRYRELLHGEAVIMGMDFASWWSKEMGHLDKDDYRIIHQHLESLGVGYRVPSDVGSRFQTIVERDKKFARKGLRFVALTAIGQGRIFENIDASDLWKALYKYLQTGSLLQYR